MMAPQEAPGGGGRRKRRAPAAHEPPTDAEMEEQLAAHATVAHNEFVSAYSRRTSVRFAISWPFRRSLEADAERWLRLECRR